MTFASRLTRFPRVYAPVSDLWQGMDDPGGALSDFIAGVAGCSPYLWELLQKERDWWPEALEAPETALDTVLSEMGGGMSLRQAKRRVHLLVALADLGGVWTLEDVTGWLTRFADRAVQVAFQESLQMHVKRLPGVSQIDETCAGGIVIAMGKMGADELNYSSDIDLIMLFDDNRFAPDDLPQARQGFVKATQAMAKRLSERTADGYVLRTDLRLRPDPSVTPVCLSVSAAENYYESLGRTWERAAYIKARAAAGDLSAGQGFLTQMAPFVWRRHLDFAAIEDAHNIRLRIREHKKLGADMDLEGHNIKLGRGGIREIEFFTQTRQLISGGRDTELRVRGTCEGLEVLAQKDWIEASLAQELQDHYRFYRMVEHRLQMVRDAQTHVLPNTVDEFNRLAAMMGRETGDLRAELSERLRSVDAVIEKFFKPRDGKADIKDTPAEDPDLVQGWLSYPALRSDRAVEIFERLKPEILTRLGASAHPHEALIAFDRFLSQLPAGVQVLSLFQANPQLIDLLADIAGTAPALAEYLSRNATVFDAVIAGDFFASWPGKDALIKDLSTLLQSEYDYERQLDMARRWKKEWHFRIGVHFLRGLCDADYAATQYSELAEAVITSLWPVVVGAFAAKHGSPPGRGASLLAMGSLGSGQLSATSDLDLIVIYDAQGIEASDGKRPLPVRSYYARLTQALITALSAPTAEGRLYEVDMRLRPSGNKGPVATSWEAFQNYQAQDAWAWEHLAMTRARTLNDLVGLGADITAFLDQVVHGRYSHAALKEALRDMRARIAAARSDADLWQAKQGAGFQQDVELFAQTVQLAAGHRDAGTKAGLETAIEVKWIDLEQMSDLNKAYRLSFILHQVLNLLGAEGPDQLGAGAIAFLLRETGYGDIAEFETALKAVSARANDVIDRTLTEKNEV